MFLLDRRSGVGMRTPEVAWEHGSKCGLSGRQGGTPCSPYPDQGSQGLSLVPSFDPGCQTGPNFCQG